MSPQVQTFDSGMLRLGDVLDMGSEGQMIVTMVNDSRAVCRPISRVPVAYKTASGKLVEFEALQSSVNISPRSSVPILQRLGKDGLEEFLANSDESKKSRNNAVSDEEKEARRLERVKQKRERAERKALGITREVKGKLGLLLGHSVISVLRAMGRHGWDEDKAHKALKAQKITASDSTVRRALVKGSKGRGRIAPVSKQQLATLLTQKKKGK